MTRLVEWYNEDRPHMSLDEGETPAKAFVRKMPPRGQRVIDEQSGIVYEARQGGGGERLFGSHKRTLAPQGLNKARIGAALLGIFSGRSSAAAPLGASAGAVGERLNDRGAAGGGGRA